jgi:hypothetical protein
MFHAKYAVNNGPQIGLQAGFQTSLQSGPQVVALQSVSSGNFLDGRNPGMNDPCLSSSSGRNPATDRYFHWRLVPTNGGHYAIRSVSSNGCLDGRNPQMTELLQSDRDPTNDHYLQWDLVPVDGNFALRSVSSGGYIDGRSPEHTQPLITYRNPAGDRYLQWKVVRF